MVAYQGSQVGSVAISEAVGRLKTVRPDGNFAALRGPWASASAIEGCLPGELSKRREFCRNYLFLATAFIPLPIPWRVPLGSN